MNPNKPTERVLKVVNNGIYERRVVEREQRPTDWKALEQWLKEEVLSDNTFLDQVRSVARRVLADHGIETDGGLPCFTTPEGGRSSTPAELAELPEIVRDACGLLCTLHGQESSYIAKLIFTAGRLFERMGVRPFEPLAAIGRKCREEGRKGGSAEKLTDDERRERIERADKAIAEYKTRYGHDCKVGMMWNRISRKLGFCKKSYDRYVKALRKADKDSGDNPR